MLALSFESLGALLPCSLTVLCQNAGLQKYPTCWIFFLTCAFLHHIVISLIKKVISSERLVPLCLAFMPATTSIYILTTFIPPRCFHTSKICENSTMLGLLWPPHLPTSLCQPAKEHLLGQAVILHAPQMPQPHQPALPQDVSYGWNMALSPE